MKVKEQKRYIQRVRQTVNRTINKYNLIQPDDKIVVGLSGGKDSLALLDSLATRREYLPFDYEITALHVDIQNFPYEIDVNAINRFCNDLHVQFRCITIHFDWDKQKKPSPCYICSSKRRTELFRYINRTNNNKLALGHHLDDALETLFLNMIHNANISSLPPRLSMFNNSFEIIRPLIRLTNKQLLKYSEIQQFPEQVKECQYGSKSSREDMRQIIDNITPLAPHAKANIFKSMSNIDNKYLPEW